MTTEEFAALRHWDRVDDDGVILTVLYGPDVAGDFFAVDQSTKLTDWLLKKHCENYTLVSTVEPPAPTWPTPVAWDQLKEGETYWVNPKDRWLNESPQVECGSYAVKHEEGVICAQRDDYYIEGIAHDSENRPMIYADDETGTGKAKAAAAMQILLQEWARG